MSTTPDMDKAREAALDETGYAPMVPKVMRRVKLVTLEECERRIAEAVAVEPETCICAAIKTAEGQIIRGHRHNFCLGTISALGLTRMTGPEAQGFVTSLGRFVDRQEALKLQQAAGIPSASGAYRGTELYSEDLY